MSEPELDDVQKKIADAQTAAKDLADRAAIDPDAVDGPKPRQTEDANDDGKPTTTDA